MSKELIIKGMSKRLPTFTQAQLNHAYDAMVSSVHEEVSELEVGDSFIVSGFISIHKKLGAERTGRNFQTNEKIVIPAQVKLSYRSVKPMIDAMDSNA